MRRVCEFRREIPNSEDYEVIKKITGMNIDNYKFQSRELARMRVQRHTRPSAYSMHGALAAAVYGNVHASARRYQNNAVADILVIIERRI